MLIRYDYLQNSEVSSFAQEEFARVNQADPFYANLEQINSRLDEEARNLSQQSIKNIDIKDAVHGLNDGARDSSLGALLGYGKFYSERVNAANTDRSLLYNTSHFLSELAGDLPVFTLGASIGVAGGAPGMAATGAVSVALIKELQKEITYNSYLISQGKQPDYAASALRALGNSSKDGLFAAVTTKLGEVAYKNLNKLLQKSLKASDPSIVANAINQPSTNVEVTDKITQKASSVLKQPQQPTKNTAAGFKTTKIKDRQAVDQVKKQLSSVVKSLPDTSNIKVPAANSIQDRLSQNSIIW